jgi:hypothetical protein
MGLLVIKKLCIMESNNPPLAETSLHDTNELTGLDQCRRDSNRMHLDMEPPFYPYYLFGFLSHDHECHCVWYGCDSNEWYDT